MGEKKKQCAHLKPFLSTCVPYIHFTESPPARVWWPMKARDLPFYRFVYPPALTLFFTFDFLQFKNIEGKHGWYLCP